MTYHLPTYRKIFLVSFVVFTGLIWLVSLSNFSLGLFLSLLIGVFIIPLDYLINQYLIPRFYNRQKYLSFILLLVIAIALLIGLQSLVTYKMAGLFITQDMPIERRSAALTDYTLLTTVLLCAFATISSIITITTDLQAQRKKVVELERDQIKSELEFLKAQINPHFLFNALNTAYFQIDQTNENARKTIMEVSEMLRYMLYDTNSEYMSLEKELVYIKSYISIQQLRSNKRLEVQSNLDDLKVENKRIAPLILIPFVENAFKHVSRQKEKSNTIEIMLTLLNDGLTFQVCNTKDNRQHDNSGRHDGIGLANVKRRLELIYPNMYNLAINDTPNNYEVTLTLNKWL